MGGDDDVAADPLTPEPERHLIRPLPAGDVEPWRRAVYRVLRRNAVRFDGREDVVGTRPLAYLRAVREVVDLDQHTFAQVVTGLRLMTVRSLIHAESGGVSFVTAAEVIRDLHEQVIRTVETTPY